MRLDSYRSVLSVPGVRSLFVLAMLARIPITAMGMALTLHVVQSLHRGYGAAGVVMAAMTVGTAFGAPLMGRVVDSRGLRLVLAITTVAEGVFWAASPMLPYPALVVGAFLAGLLALPVFSVVRQSLAAVVPEQHRRAAFSLDSMSVELSYMVGPAVAVALATTLPTTVALLSVGAATVLSGVGLYAVNPPVRGENEGPITKKDRVPRKQWLRGPMIAMLATASGATLVLGGAEVAMVAAMREAGQLKWVGIVMVAWGVYSLIGGFLHGAVRRSLPALALMGLLGLTTIPLALADHWWLFLIVLLPSGMLCAPTLAATGDQVSRLAPPSARGEAMGFYGSALTIGLAIGAPLSGAVVDRFGPDWGFAVVGIGGALIAAGGLLAQRLSGPVETGDVDNDVDNDVDGAVAAEAVVATVAEASVAAPAGAAGVGSAERAGGGQLVRPQVAQRKPTEKVGAGHTHGE